MSGSNFEVAGSFDAPFIYCFRPISLTAFQCSSGSFPAKSLSTVQTFFSCIPSFLLWNKSFALIFLSFGSLIFAPVFIFFSTCYFYLFAFIYFFSFLLSFLDFFKFSFLFSVKTFIAIILYTIFLALFAENFAYKSQ